MTGRTYTKVNRLIAEGRVGSNPTPSADCGPSRDRRAIVRRPQAEWQRSKSD
jgi:hypothetical protein